MHLFSIISKVHQIRQIVSVSTEVGVIESAEWRAVEVQTRAYTLFGVDKSTVADYIVLHPRSSSSLPLEGEGEGGSLVVEKKEGALRAMGDLLDCLHFLQNSKGVGGVDGGQTHVSELDGMISSWITEHLNSKGVFQKITGKARGVESNGSVDGDIEKLQILLQVRGFIFICYLLYFVSFYF